MIQKKYEKRKLKYYKGYLISIFFISFFITNFSLQNFISANTNSNDQIVMKEEEASIKFKGRVGEMDPEETDPNDPNVPGPGMDWIKVKIPLTTEYYSTAESKHKTISSREYKFENMSAYPVEISISGFSSHDGSSVPDTNGVNSLDINNDLLKIPLVKNNIPQKFDKQDKRIKLFSLAPGSKTPALGKFEGNKTEKITFSGNTLENIDIGNKLTLNNQLEFTFVGLDQDGKAPEKPSDDLTEIKVKDTQIIVGTPWKAEDNYIVGRDEKGMLLNWSQIKVAGDTVNSNIPGKYKVTYSYGKVTVTATVNVVDKDHPILPDDPDGEITFAKLKWSIIKGPDEMGEDNYLVSASSHSAGNTGGTGSKKFSDASFFYSSEDASVGYDKHIHYKSVTDWYNYNIRGTKYENYVQPVITHSATLEDMKKLGWRSYTDDGNNRPAPFRWTGEPNTTNPTAYPTTVDKLNGLKGAFMLSASDISDGKVDAQGLMLGVRPSAQAWFDRVEYNYGIKYMSTRTTGGSQYVTTITQDKKGSPVTLIPKHVNEYFMWTPSLVLHIEK